MNAGFILWAQALDNESPDHISMGGRHTEGDDTPERMNAVSAVYAVRKRGGCVFENRGLRLSADNWCFVLEVLSVQRDNANRLAPIVCHGEYNLNSCDTLGDIAMGLLKAFAADIGRTIEPSHFELARESFRALKKKEATRRVRATAVMGSAAVFFVALLIMSYLRLRA